MVRTSLSTLYLLDVIPVFWVSACMGDDLPFLCAGGVEAVFFVRGWIWTRVLQHLVQVPCQICSSSLTVCERVLAL